ncbi:MAG TPA: GNVR domain-containing protein [Steroidobacteraceae bacterium]|nr:GNVR domain-containing protein [Steroidobacteraceae bacterium]
MTLAQLVRILVARRRMFFSIFCSVLILALAASLLLPKKYLGEAAVIADVSTTDPYTNTANVPQQMQSAFVATQMDVIGSRNVALKVVRDLKLKEDPFFTAKLKAVSPAAIDDAIADVLLDKLSVRSSHNGNVIYIQYPDTSPTRAAKIANGFADAYVQTSVELKVSPMRGQLASFDKQSEELRSTLEKAQQKLSAYQSDHGLIGTDDARLDVENARLEELSNQLVAAQSAMYASNARSTQMDQANSLQRPDEMSDLFKNPLMQSLKTELARAEAKFADVSQRFDRNHPQYMSAAAELAAIQKKVDQEMQNARATISREASISRQQAASLQRAVEQQRERILSLKAQQDEYAVLKREVDSARTAYDAALQRSGQTRLQSQLEHSNIAVLDRAAVPEQPSSPRLVLNMILAIFIAPLLAAAICIFTETLHPRIHTELDLEGNSFGPLLAEIPSDRFAGRRIPARRPS